MKLRALSDLHVGHPANRDAIAALPSYGDDWLIVAGDVGETESHMNRTLSELCKRFAQVLWVPGNHELWTLHAPTTALDAARGEDRYDRLVQLCRNHGVLTPEDPYPTWTGEGGPHVIAPLFVLYDYSFRPANVPLAEVIDWAAEENSVCADEQLLYPDPYPSRAAWCAARVALTERRLDAVAAVNPGARLVLVNHFALDERLLRLWMIPRFTPWCGTRKTAAWHTRYPVDVVVHGHTHMRATMVLDGVRFEEVSLGYPRHWAQEKGAAAYVRQILPAPATPWMERGRALTPPAV